MPSTFDILAIALGLLVGLALAASHVWLSRRAAERLLTGGPRSHMALGFLLRVSLSALGLAALMSISTASLLAALFSFWLGQRVALRRATAPTIG